jgi:nucleoside permease NupC
MNYEENMFYTIVLLVVWGVSLQLLFGLLILRWELGKSVLACVSKKVDKFLAFTDAGSGFVFGFLVTQQPFLPGRVASNDLVSML